jgi:hypothetical protein
MSYDIHVRERKAKVWLCCHCFAVFMLSIQVMFEIILEFVEVGLSYPRIYLMQAVMVCFLRKEGL